MACTYGGITTFYIGNLPPHCSSNGLWRAFERFGDIADAFVPVKTAKNGKPFGFIRYINVLNFEGLLWRLNSVYIGGFRAHAYIARFCKDASPSIMGHPPHANNVAATKTTFGGPYKEVVSGGAALTVEETKKKIPRLKLMAATKWLGCSLVGTAIDLDILDNLGSLIIASGVSGLHVRYIGGLKVLITFPGVPIGEQKLKELKIKWLRLFSDLYLWDEGTIEYARVAWITVRGIPTHLWDPELVNHVGGLMGEVVYGSQINGDESNLSYDRIAILVNNGTSIDARISVSYVGTEFVCWINEVDTEWVPKFLRGNGELGVAGTPPTPAVSPAPVGSDNSRSKEEEGEGSNNGGDVSGSGLHADGSSKDINSSTNSKDVNGDEGLINGDKDGSLPELGNVVLPTNVEVAHQINADNNQNIGNNYDGLAHNDDPFNLGPIIEETDPFKNPEVGSLVNENNRRTGLGNKGKKKGLTRNSNIQPFKLWARGGFTKKKKLPDLNCVPLFVKRSKLKYKKNRNSNTHDKASKSNSSLGVEEEFLSSGLGATWLDDEDVWSWESEQQVESEVGDTRVEESIVGQEVEEGEIIDSRVERALRLGKIIGINTIGHESKIRRLVTEEVRAQSLQ